MGRRVVGPQRQCPVLGGKSIGEPAEILQRHTTVAVRLGEGAGHAHRRIELAQRLARPPLAEADIAHDVAADRVLQRGAAGGVQHGRGLIEVTGLDVRDRRAQRIGERALCRSRTMEVLVHAAGKLAEPAANCEGPKAPGFR